MAKSDDRFSDNALDERSADAGSIDDTPTGDASSGDYAPAKAAPAADQGPLGDPAALRRTFADGTRAEQAEALGRMLSFAPWDEIWTVVDRRRARELFPDVDLPESLRAAWARYLGVADDEAADGDA